MESQEQSPEMAQAQLDALKAKATTLGLTFSGNIGIAKLREKIDAHQNPPEAPKAEKPKMSAVQLLAARRSAMIKECTKLIRVRISCMNPSKADLEGEIFTVGNKLVGTIRRMVPFGEKTDGGTHVENIILNQMETRMFQQIKTKVVDGQIKVSTRMVPEFNIQRMPSLTQAELTELGNKQDAASRLGG
ncbi:MAG: hypothetical protein JKY54_01890 [Flavobacteriales bacterium]|nr:hypothetical protein [Flavobacteriales bacterium]